jgi:hypothetical protein
MNAPPGELFSEYGDEVLHLQKRRQPELVEFAARWSSIDPVGVLPGRRQLLSFLCAGLGCPTTDRHVPAEKWSLRP